MSNIQVVPVPSENYPAYGFAVLPGINMKTTTNYTVELPGARNYMVTNARLITTAADTISNGASISVIGIDNTDTVEATLTTAMTGTNNDIVLTSKLLGTAGNAITLTLVDAGEPTTISVSVSSTDITVNLNVNGFNTIDTTATQLINAINNDAEASALVTASLAQALGTGIVTALTETALSGGADYVLKSTFIASTNLADSDAVGIVQTVGAASATSKTVTGNDSLMLQVTAGTATTDVKDVYLEYIAL